MLSDLTRTSLLATVALALAWAPVALGAENLSEDVRFGCGLAEKKFPDLAIEVLSPQLQARLEEDADRKLVYAALLVAHKELGSRRYTELSADAEKKLREEHLSAAARYEELLKKLEPAADPTSLDGLIALRNKALRLAQEAADERNEQARNRLNAQMMEAFETTIRGMVALVAKLKAPIQKHEQDMPDWDKKAAFERWEREHRDLQDPYIRAALELNRTRHMYYRALPATDRARRDPLLAKTIEELDELCAEFDQWAYSIIGRLTLCQAYTDQRKYEDARESAEPGLLLAEELIKQDKTGQVKASIVPYRNKLLAAWAYAVARLNKFDEAVARLKDVRDAANRPDPEIESRVGEILLMKAQALDAAQKKAEADAIREQAKGVLNGVASVDEASAQRVSSILEKFGLGGAVGYHDTLNKLEDARRRRDNEAIIQYATRLLSFGSTVPADKRAYAMTVLGSCYWQERMWYEAYTVYKHLATSPEGGDDPEKWARFVPVALQRQFETTQDPADRLLLENARKWLRDNFGGPDREFEEGRAARGKGDYTAAIEQFAKVPATSAYYESALAQIGECHVLLAKKLRQPNPAQSAEHLEKGKAALLKFLDYVQKHPSEFPSILRRRKQIKAGAVYRLATVYMWPGKEDYKACVALTEGYTEQFPDATVLHAYVFYNRVRAFVELGELEKAETELVQLKRAASQLTETDAERQEEAKQLVSYPNDLLFRAYVDRSQTLRKEEAELREQARALGAGNEEAAKLLLEKADEAKTRADQYSDRALDIVAAAFAENPNQPFDKFLYVIYQYHRQNRPNDLRLYLELFLKRFGSDETLTPAQREEVDKARTLIGLTLFACGDFRLAEQALREREAALDRAFEELRKRDREAKRSPEYWTVRLHLAKAAKELAAESGEHWNRAMAIFVDLHKQLEEYSDNWWDVTASIAELRDIREEYDDTLLVVGRYVAVRPQLGGPAIRARYIQLLKQILRRGNKEQKSKALNLAVQIELAGVEELRADQQMQISVKHERILRGIDSVRIDYGTDVDMTRFREIVKEVVDNAVDERMKQEAQELLKKIGG